MVQDGRKSSAIDWIDLTASAKPGPAVAEAPRVDHVRIMEMDESTGKPKASQVEFEDRDRQGQGEELKPVGLPWRDWIVDNKVLGCVESDKAAAVVCMHSIHENFDVVSQQIDAADRHSDQCCRAGRSRGKGLTITTLYSKAVEGS